MYTRSVRHRDQGSDGVAYWHISMNLLATKSFFLQPTAMVRLFLIVARSGVTGQVLTGYRIWKEKYDPQK